MSKLSKIYQFKLADPLKNKGYKNLQNGVLKSSVNFPELSSVNASKSKKKCPLSTHFEKDSQYPVLKKFHDELMKILYTYFKFDHRRRRYYISIVRFYDSVSIYENNLHIRQSGYLILFEALREARWTNPLSVISRRSPGLTVIAFRYIFKRRNVLLGQ